MSATQMTIFNIIGELSVRHDSFEGVSQDRVYQAWIKHVKDKRAFESRLKREFAARHRAKQMELKLIPRYF
jgi:hypothetical protein